MFGFLDLVFVGLKHKIIVLMIGSLVSVSLISDEGNCLYVRALKFDMLGFKRNKLLWLISNKKL